MGLLSQLFGLKIMETSEPIGCGAQWVFCPKLFGLKIMETSEPIGCGAQWVFCPS